MKEQVIKGWVTLVADLGEEPIIHLLKGSTQPTKNQIEYMDIDKRKLRNLMSNALNALGYKDFANEDEDWENGIVEKRICENVSMQLYASDICEPLDSIKEKVVLDSMGLLNFEIQWYGYSSWTIEGFEITKFKLGGHNILDIINNYKDKYVYLIVGYAS